MRSNEFLQTVDLLISFLNIAGEHNECKTMTRKNLYTIGTVLFFVVAVVMLVQFDLLAKYSEPKNEQKCDCHEDIIRSNNPTVTPR